MENIISLLEKRRGEWGIIDIAFDLIEKIVTFSLFCH